jgi:hypothetical protein
VEVEKQIFACPSFINSSIIYLAFNGIEPWWIVIPFSIKDTIDEKS